MNARPLFIHALSPLHAGTGQGVGVIDLPIAREVATGLPFLPGSSVKGTLRDTPGIDAATRTLLFGPDTANASEHAGSVQFTDQRLLLMPVRSLAGTFAWVTSPYVLQRFARDIHDAGDTTFALELPQLNPPATDERELCLVGEATTALIVASVGSVVLEDLDLQPTKSAAIDAWATWLGVRLFPDGSREADYWRTCLAGRLCVVSDDILDFLLTTATEVTARVRIDDNHKTVAEGGLWYEESLPTETILAGLVLASPVSNREREPKKLSVEQIFTAVANLTGGPLQFGGKATVGRGLCRARLG